MLEFDIENIRVSLEADPVHPLGPVKIALQVQFRPRGEQVVPAGQHVRSGSLYRAARRTRLDSAAVGVALNGKPVSSRAPIRSKTALTVVPAVGHRAAVRPLRVLEVV